MIKCKDCIHYRNGYCENFESNNYNYPQYPLFGCEDGDTGNWLDRPEAAKWADRIIISLIVTIIMIVLFLRG